MMTSSGSRVGHSLETNSRKGILALFQHVEHNRRPVSTADFAPSPTTLFLVRLRLQRVTKISVLDSDTKCNRAPVVGLTQVQSGASTNWSPSLKVNCLTGLGTFAEGTSAVLALAGYSACLDIGSAATLSHPSSAGTGAGTGTGWPLHLPDFTESSVTVGTLPRGMTFQSGPSLNDCLT